jgi:L-ascorbate metabolism protein UlaG (beta-lactamase superfamily)
MEIWYLGFGSFRIRTKKGIIITDPFNEKALGLKMPRLEANIVTVSRSDSPHNHIQAAKNQPFIIDAPGEYEINGVNILGIPSYSENKEEQSENRNTIYLVHANKICFGHLGQLNHRLAKNSLEELNSPDILFLPLGEESGLTPKEAIEITRQIGAKIILPIHYIKEKGNSPLEEVEVIKRFLEEMGVSPEPKQKLTVTKNTLSEEKEEIVILRKRDR